MENGRGKREYLWWCNNQFAVVIKRPVIWDASYALTAPNQHLGYKLLQLLHL
jgi:hypothetical protein